MKFQLNLNGEISKKEIEPDYLLGYYKSFFMKSTC